MSTGRNEPCPCASGKKYKHCCLATGGPENDSRNRHISFGIGLIIVATLISYFAISEAAAGLAAALGLAALGLWLWLTAEPPKAGGGADPSAINFGR